jgi:hypothetical protein
LTACAVEDISLLITTLAPYWRPPDLTPAAAPFVGSVISAAPPTNAAPNPIGLLESLPPSDAAAALAQLNDLEIAPLAFPPDRIDAAFSQVSAFRQRHDLVEPTLMIGIANSFFGNFGPSHCVSPTR